MDIEEARVARDEIEAVVIGCGSIGRKHYANLLASGAKVMAAADPEFGRVFPEVPERYDDADECLEEQSKGRAVIIASPSHLHASQALRAISAGATSLLVEKPPAISSQEWAPVKAAAEEAGTRLAVAFNYRFHATIDEILVHRVRLEKKQAFAFIGAIDNVITWPGWGPDTYALNPAGGGVLLTSTVHALDLANFIFTPIVALVSAVSRGMFMDEATVDDMNVIRANHENGTVSLIYQAWTAPPWSCIGVVRDSDCVVLSLSDNQYEQARRQMHGRMMGTFVNFARTGRSGNLCTAAEALHTMRCVDAIRESWDKRIPVKVEGANDPGTVPLRI